MFDAARELALCGEGHERSPGREIGIDRLGGRRRDGAMDAAFGAIPTAGVSTNG